MSYRAAPWEEPAWEQLSKQSQDDILFQYELLQHVNPEEYNTAWEQIRLKRQKASEP